MDDQIQSFLDAIRAHPADDGPRLLFADWLDERGDPWGEFIRVQCALASPALSASDRKRLTDSEELHLKFGAPQRHAVVHRMLHRHGLVNHFSHRRGPIYRWGERRGFIAEVEVDAAYLATNASTIWRIGPLETLRLRALNDVPFVEMLLAIPGFRSISQLDLRHPSNDLNLSRQLVKSRYTKADLVPERQERYIDSSSTWPRFVSDIIRDSVAVTSERERPARSLPNTLPGIRNTQWERKLADDESRDFGLKILAWLGLGMGLLFYFLQFLEAWQRNHHQGAMR